MFSEVSCGFSLNYNNIIILSKRINYSFILHDLEYNHGMRMPLFVYLGFVYLKFYLKEKNL